MFQSMHYGICGRAIDNGLVTLSFYNPRDFSGDPNKRVDDRPFGGGPGMVMMVQPLRDAIRGCSRSPTTSSGDLHEPTRHAPNATQSSTNQ